ncbi:MAG: hypothetical protein IKS20_00960, partial [Victivallales bacterium]|nr:hypothetical protein [Victivallales bacterium]
YALCGDGFEIPLAGTWKAKMEYDLGHITPPPRFSIQLHNTPAMQFDSMVRPLLPFAIQGVIWYQGESNGNTMQGSMVYQRKMETMIKDWRFHFELPDMPFIQVQLADFRSPKSYDVFSDWAVLREAQRKACHTLPRVFMVTALDTGEEDNIHPQDKKEIGYRLAASALHNIYGQDVLPCGPEYRKAVPEDGGLRVFFDYAEGMELRGQPGKSLYIAGADGKFHPADSAVIDGDSILLKSDKVKKPLFVRYAWSDNPNNILYNREYPAAAFSSEEG